LLLLIKGEDSVAEHLIGTLTQGVLQRLLITESSLLTPTT